MSKRLVKVAKELNVGTGSIVDFLANSGFEVDNKPTAKVSEEMYDLLVQEFRGSMNVKEQADQLVIGTSRQSVKKTEEDKKSPFSDEREAEKAKKKAEQEEKSRKDITPVEEVEKKRETAGGLKIVGKIDLDQKPMKKEEVKEKEKVEEKEEVKEKTKVEAKEEVKKEVVEEIKEVIEEKKEVVEEKVKEEIVSKKVEKEIEKKVAPESKKVEKEKEVTPPAVPDMGTVEEKLPVKKTDNLLIKADAPRLKGLKILGKISAEQLEPKRRKKKVEPEPEKKAAAAATEDSSPKRKRRRRKIVKPQEQKGKGVGRTGQKKKGPDDVREVTQKEIEEQIKATMARLNKGGKSKRQKSRRDKRETFREKEELKQLQEDQQKSVEVTEFISVQELANMMDVSATDVITVCMNIGVIVSINQRLDAEIIELVAEEFGHEVIFVDAEDNIDVDDEYEDDPEDLETRSPIVTVMGHVDHGKTSLLDYIREEKVAEGEAGGITQHIGAYEVNVGVDDKRITFLDTPGHEAFTAMRARGAKVTDVAVVIIAADDSIMPQTKEAISHSQAAGVPMVFAINKIDKPGADPERIKQELASMNLLVEDWGGKYQSQEISATKGTNIDLLLEKILPEAELLDLKANPNRRAYGTVVEASLDKGRGYVSKILVQNGTLRISDPIVAGEHSGKVRAMFNEFGKRVDSAGPSQPVLVLGLGGAPQAGELMKVLESEQEAKQLATKRAQIIREQTNRAAKRISLDEIGRRLALGNFKELNLIVKGDVDGSVEALSDSLIKLSVESIQVNVIHKGVGQIIESDVLLATASDAIIIGFQVRPSLGARKLAEAEGVQIKTYSIIYDAIEEVTMAMEGMLEPTKEEKITGQLEVRSTFKVSKVGTVAGCIVQEGTINRNNFVRVIRDGIVVYPSKEGQVASIDSLKRFKDDVREVKSGIECGVTIKNYNDLIEGDTIEAYEVIEVKQTL